MPSRRKTGRREQRKGLCPFCPEAKRRLVTLTRHWNTCPYYKRQNQPSNLVSRRGHLSSSNSQPSSKPSHGDEDEDHSSSPLSPGDMEPESSPKGQGIPQQAGEWEDEDDEDDSYCSQAVHAEEGEDHIEFVETAHQPFQLGLSSTVDLSPQQEVIPGAGRPTDPRDILRRSILLDDRDEDEMSVLLPDATIEETVENEMEDDLPKQHHDRCDSSHESGSNREHSPGLQAAIDQNPHLGFTIHKPANSPCYDAWRMEDSMTLSMIRLIDYCDRSNSKSRDFLDQLLKIIAEEIRVRNFNPSLAPTTKTVRGNVLKRYGNGAHPDLGIFRMSSYSKNECNEIVFFFK
jgi:hypothetical protein